MTSLLVTGILTCAFMMPAMKSHKLPDQPADTTSGRRDTTVPARVAGVVAAERAFRADAARIGTRRAFLAHAHETAVLFRPRAVNAREFLEAQKDRPGLLEWEPAFADVSAAGDLGFTTGPWTFRASDNDTVIASGSYATVWRRDADGPWKFVIDLGASEPGQAPVPEPGAVVAAAIDDRETIDVRAIRDAATLKQRDEDLLDLMRLERELGEATPGAADRFAKLVRADARFLREMAPAIIGGEPIRERLSTDSLPSVEPVGGIVSSSGDLAYTYGRYRIGAPGDAASTPSASGEEGNYLRVWRRSGGSWTILFEVLAPL